MNIEKIIRETPLDIRIKVSVHFFLNDFIHDIGLRKKGYWTDSEHDKHLSNELNKATNDLTKRILEEINTVKTPF